MHPTPEIHFISNTGTAEITFNFRMVVPTLYDMQSATVEIDGQILPAIALKVKPGYYSDVNSLNFTYNITDY